MLKHIPPVLLLPAALALAAPASAQAPAGATPFTIDDAIDLTRVADPQLSPDGARVVFTRTELDWAENERLSRLWIANADGTDARPFTGGEGDGAARWSPDGRWLAFTRSVGEDDKTRQLFLLRGDGGEARQLTKHPTSIGRYTWTPDSRRIFFVAEDSLTKEEKDGREDGADAVFVDEPPNGQQRGRWANLWWVAADPDSGTSHPVTAGERIVDDFAVSPDGRHIAFTYRTENARNDEFRTEIAIVEVPAAGAGSTVSKASTGSAAAARDGGMADVRPLAGVRRLTMNEAPESDLAWSPDGRSLAFIAPDLETWRLDQGNLYVMDVAEAERALGTGADAAKSPPPGMAGDAPGGGPPAGTTGAAAIRQLAADFAGAIRDYAWAPDGRSVHLVALERTVANLYRLDVGTGEVQQVSRLEGVVGSASYSRDHSRIAYTFAAPTEPGDVFTATTGDFDAVRVTDANPAVRGRALATPEVVRWQSADGLEVEGLLYLPAGGRTRPGAFVLEIHGGPAGVFTRGFDADAQVLAAHGYAVLQPNVRGSSGYGDALLRGNMNDIGGGDYRDLMTGVDAMIRLGVAHPDSLAVKGWSYGGILGGWTLTRTDRFKAASLGAMVSDWRSEFGPGFNYDVTRWYLGGDPWSNRGVWIERSSFTHLDRVKTPTLLFHGDNDRTDTIGQSFNYYAGLEHRGVPARFIRFPREGHGIREPRHARTRMVEELRWFQHWVRGDADWKAPERPEKEKEVAEVAG